MHRFIKSAPASDPSPPKRARLDQAEPPPVAEQHAFLDLSKKRDWASIRTSLSASPGLINVQPMGRWSVLHQAAEAANAETVTFLLEQRADVNSKTKDGKTPLEVAKLESVRHLLRSHVSPASVPGPSEAAARSPPTVKEEVKPTTVSADSTASTSGCVAAAAPKSGPHAASIPVWQVQPEALPGKWVDMGKERQALLNDAKAAGVLTAMFRENGRSYIVQLDARMTLLDFASGGVRPIRLQTPAISSAQPASPPKVASATTAVSPPTAVAPKEGKVDGAELAAGESVDVPGSGSKPYTVKNCGGGVWSCTCVAWKMQGKKPTNQRSCKHIVGIRGAEAEDARLASVAASAAVGSASSSADAAPRSWTAVSTPPKRAPPVTLTSTAKTDGAKAAPALLLANKWEEHVDPTGWWISEKLDGMRAFWDPAKGCLFSRLGNPVMCPKPFLATLPDVALDGELFLGRGRFQELMSVVKNSSNAGRVDGPWKDVVYVVFDMPAHGGKFEERMEVLRAQLGDKTSAGVHQFARYHEQQLCKGRDHLDDDLKRVQAKDGEGLMLRRAGSLYESGRSSSLLKVKTFQDEEAVVIGHEAGKGRNSAVTGALQCRNRAGILFSVGSGLNDAQRADPPKIGEIITYRFFELTKDNKPRFPSFVGVRADADRTGLIL